MRKYIIVFSILLGLFIILLIFNQSIINTYDGRLCVSNSIQTSKQNHLYLGIYRPLKDSVKLKDKTIKAVDIWAEKSWRDGHRGLFFSEIYAEEGMNIIAPFKVNMDTLPIEYFAVPQDKSYVRHLGGRPGLGFVYSYPGKPDTIILYIEQRKADSWQETVLTDSILYAKTF